MPLILLVRIVMTLVSLTILAVAAYLLWTWYDGHIIQDTNGVLHRIRDDWRLWTGIALVAWSFFGRLIVKPLLARQDTDPSRATRSEGRSIVGASGSELYVETLGPSDAPVIVFTHGWSMDSTIWYYAKRDLSKQFRLIFWDLPGLGRSNTVAPDITLDAFANDLKTIIRLAGSKPVVLVGHSIGGMTIQTLAKNHPEFFAAHVAGTVLVNTTYTNPLKTMALSRLAQALRRPLIEPLMHVMIWLQPVAWLGSWQSYLSGSAHIANRIGFGKYVTHSQLEHTTLLSTRNPPGVIAKGNLAMFRWDATDAMARITTPMLVLGGAMDIVTKPEASRYIAAEKGASGDLQIVEGVNHMGFLERSDIYNQAIADFATAVQISR
jgi:pimeloyl-ACP methyl ester carboxylesterase